MDQSKYQSYWYHTSVGTDTSVLDSLSYALYIPPISSVSRHVFACLCKHYCSPNLHAQLAPPVLYCVLLLSCDSLLKSVSISTWKRCYWPCIYLVSNNTKIRKLENCKKKSHYFWTLNLIGSLLPYLVLPALLSVNRPSVPPPHMPLVPPEQCLVLIGYT